MGLRCFHTEHRPGGVTERWFSDEAGNITRKTEQDTAGHREAVQQVAADGNHKGKARYLLGSVPIVLAQAWAKECGYGISTKEWVDYAKKKLMDPDYRDISTGVKI